MLLREQGCDFFTGCEIDTLMHHSEPIDIHHIFPRSWCEKNSIKREEYDSVVNKTPLSSKTNKIVGSHAPSVYLSSLQKKASIAEERMDKLLRSHVIDPDALRADDFDKFFQTRHKMLLERIEKAMGKTLLYDDKSLEDVEPTELDEEL
ncbi:MAG: HNH endonuclease domain-containing protein [Rhizonema sp. PD37]|nr:HNH endonuclease domain-containing protein [Rhizonema sp. PD37]